MKTSKRILLGLLALVLAIQITHAQNTKVPRIDGSGKITDKAGKHLGAVTKKGVITNANITTIAHVDGTGELIVDQTGEHLGKVEKNGNFLPKSAKSKEDGWFVSAAVKGMCSVKDKGGNIQAEVYEAYRAYGASAVYCLTHK